MDGVLCPIVVGRDGELATLIEHLDAAAAGRGRLLVLDGEAGVGKSRLVRHIAALAGDRGLPVLSGRAVPGGSPLPFRPLSEALLVAGREFRPSQVPELTGFAGQLARLVPDWTGVAGAAPAGPADESPVLIGEAVVRLLRVLGRDAGCLLVLEDLHWADPETLAVVDYLADTLATERVLCLATTRPQRGTVLSDLLVRIRHRDDAVLSLEPLSEPACARMLAACLSTPAAPAELSALVVAHSDGLPFLVEELLAGLVASGALVRRDGQWRTEGPARPTVPSSLAESVYSRLRALDQTGRRVLGAAAVLGRRFDWDLLPGVADVDGTATVEVLRQAVDAQLVAAEGQRFRFRHALTREAVLAELLPPERAALSARALVAVRRAHPGLPGEWCELAGELAEAAGDLPGAAALATESARRALARGALTTAELTAERGRRLASSGSAEAADADEILVTTLVHAGKPEPARTIGHALLAGFDHRRGSSARRTELLLVLARAALAAGDATAAAAELASARSLQDAADLGTLARLDAVGAHVALACSHTQEAGELAAAAADRARQLGLPEVECESLEVLGRVTEPMTERITWFERAAELAERHGLTTWRLRALQELALADAAAGGEQRIREVRRVAEEAGAWFTVAQMDLMLADFALSTFDRDGCRGSAQRCVDASRRYGLASLPVALLWLAGAHALGGREAEMEQVLTEAAEQAPGEPRILADAWGRVRAWQFAIREDRAGLRHALDRSMEYTRTAPDTESIYPGQMYWALLRAMADDDLGAPARAEVSESGMVRAGLGRPPLALIDAVVLGRQGRSQEAAATARAACQALDRIGMRSRSMYLLRLTAEAAVRDGWGEPVEWLREAEAFFAERGHQRVARECRALLRSAGAPATRRGRGSSDVPPGLRRLGITSRELDVLVLIAQGLPTREIAASLVLSPRTVEHHVSRLLARTGLQSRVELTDLALANRVAVAP